MTTPFISYPIRSDQSHCSLGWTSVVEQPHAAESPTGNEQARSRSRLQRAQIPKRSIANLLIGRSHIRDDRAGEFGRQALIQPLGGEQTEVAAGHVDHAGRIFNLWQRRLVMGLRMIAGREGYVRRAITIGE